MLLLLRSLPYGVGASLMWIVKSGIEGFIPSTPDFLDLDLIEVVTSEYDEIELTTPNYRFSSCGIIAITNN